MIYFQILRSSFTAVLIFCLLLTLFFSCPNVAGKAKRPALVVLIAVDGLGADIFTRYDSLFTGGFRRLRDNGMNFNRAMVNHAYTISHPGHVTLSTGMNPSHHGILEGAFYKRDGQSWRFIDALQDSNEQILGVPKSTGVSPRNILVSSLPEWFIKADPQSRAVAIGAGQFSSLLHAGHLKGDVYWYMHSVGRFVTSTYYQQQYPEWVERFNRESLPKYIQSSAVWENLVPAEARKLARRDDAPYEGFRGRTTFPHSYNNVVKPENASRFPLSTWLAGTPTLDAATLGLAKEAVRERSLGQRKATDYLSIVVSAVDDIGHGYGPGSQEQLDNLLRLDRELGEFLNFLDEKVGKGNYLVALSADHGMMDIPEYRLEISQQGKRITEDEIKKVLDEVRALKAKSTGTREEIADQIVRLVKQYDFVADAMTVKQLSEKSALSDKFTELYLNNLHPNLLPRFPLFSFEDGTSIIGESGVIVRLKEGSIINLDPANHGSPYDYDRHVPLIFMGAGISKGASPKLVHTTDLAPTLAALAGIPFPTGLDGRNILTKNSQKKVLPSKVRVR